MAMRWDPCVDHRGEEVPKFLAHYFGDASRTCLLVAGAGFDPRTLLTARLLAEHLSTRLSALLIREERPSPSPRILRMAESNIVALEQLIPRCEVQSLRILAEDSAVVGGRNAVQLMSSVAIGDFTDVVVDMSALSIGTSFPIVRYLLEATNHSHKPHLNVHVLAASLPEEDERRCRVSNDVVSLVHGFQGQLRLYSHAASSRLWIPQLSISKRDVLDRIYASQPFDDVCPIIPFPSRNPRTGDLLSEAFLDQLERGWDVDTRNFLYATEEDPLDVYRSILRIDAQRRPVFERTGSVVVLSPVGSKVVALGALMAAIERDLPVVYVEALGYTLPAAGEAAVEQARLVHVWLSGDAYPNVA